MHIFAQAQRVIQSLKQHDCSAALEWCEANRARLRKAKSSLEFKLRLQEFLELVAKVTLHGKDLGGHRVNPVSGYITVWCGNFADSTT